MTQIIKARAFDSAARTQDSTLAYFINQLENFEQKLHEPLYSVTWDRDIKLRSGVTLAYELTSFTRTSVAGVGTQQANGKPWLSANSNTIPAVSVNGEKIATPLRLLGREISYSSVELERSQLLGQGIDVAQMSAFNLMYQMDTDSQVYVGDVSTGDVGLVNNPIVTAGAVTGAAWDTATPAVILEQINELLTSVWASSGYAICPSELRIPPVQYGLISTKVVSGSGNVSILQYLAQNSIANNINGRPLNIQPLKWLVNAGEGDTDRMMAYTNNEDFVRFPMVPVRRETAYYQGIRFIAPYIWGFGSVEFVYPETVGYRDGI